VTEVPPDPDPDPAPDEPRRMRLAGLHHVTAICADLERTTRFYRDVLGLALVREGQNDDDPDARHFWFGHPDGGLLVSHSPSDRPRSSTRGATTCARATSSAPTCSTVAACGRSTSAIPTATSSRSRRRRADRRSGGTFAASTSRPYRLEPLGDSCEHRPH
jgi:catechol 2,3-dioxygenase-like lactoylglutathione lyase family enzyme